jgi:hypothetical protein
MKIDYRASDDTRVHAINCRVEGEEISVGILCVMAVQESACRISSENASFLVDIPKPFRSGSERVKAFNVVLPIANHEQV